MKPAADQRKSPRPCGFALGGRPVSRKGGLPSGRVPRWLDASCGCTRSVTASSCARRLPDWLTECEQNWSNFSQKGSGVEWKRLICNTVVAGIGLAFVCVRQFGAREETFAQSLPCLTYDQPSKYGRPAPSIPKLSTPLHLVVGSIYYPQDLVTDCSNRHSF